jgi:periplasmic protein CpxP/Spy
MRKTSMTIGLALLIGAGSLAAQTTQPTPKAGDHRGHGEQGAKARGARGNGDRAMRGPGAGFLLRGIELTDAQKTRLKAIRTENASENKAEREQFRAVMQEARKLRQSGDTAAARAKLAPMHAKMQQERQQQIASIRSILTAEQQKTFDANLAAAKTRAATRGEGRGPWNGRGK